MSGYTLYEAVQLSKLSQYVDEETGEIDVAAFDQAQNNLKDKILAVAAFYLNEAAEEAAIKEVIDRLTKKRTAIKNRGVRLKEYLAFAMKEAGLEKVKADDKSYGITLSAGATKSVQIEDESKIPEIYLVQQAPTVDKEAIKKAIEDGEQVPGACIKYGDKLRIG